MGKSIYKSQGKTPQEAFENIWSLMQFNDDCCLRKEGDMWCVKLVVLKPTDKERREFEIEKQ